MAGWKHIPEWLSENRISRALLNGLHRVLFAENWDGDNSTEALTMATQIIRTEIRCFLENATIFCIPLIRLSSRR